MPDNHLSWSAKYDDNDAHTEPAQSFDECDQLRKASPLRKSCSYCKCVIVPVAIIGLSAVVAGLYVYLVDGPESLPSWGDINIFHDEDPMNGVMYPWENSDGQTGLELTLINALDSSWHTYFETAVSQWDNAPANLDSLTLQTVERQPEFECEPVLGYLKVCNGDYGATDWKGANLVFLRDGKIYQSIAKLNDYFHGDDDADTKQYTMCHEIGHGFGLPHTDESFWNRNTGNCLDYTRIPRTNKQPDEVNFHALVEMYGVVGSSPTSVTTTSNGVSTIEPNNFDNNYNDNSINNNFEGNQDEKESKSKFGNVDDRRRLEIPDWVLHANRCILQDLDVHHARLTTTTTKTTTRNSIGWRHLHENPYGRALSVDLGEGYSAQVHYLLAVH